MRQTKNRPQQALPPENFNIEPTSGNFFNLSTESACTAVVANHAKRTNEEANLPSPHYTTLFYSTLLCWIRISSNLLSRRIDRVHRFDNATNNPPSENADAEKRQRGPANEREGDALERVQRGSTSTAPNTRTFWQSRTALSSSELLMHNSFPFIKFIISLWIRRTDRHVAFEGNFRTLSSSLFERSIHSECMPYF